MKPLYSQGMTICALETERIDHDLDAALAGTLSFRELQCRLCEVVDGAWHMATTEDLRFPETVGERSSRTRFHHWYGAGLGKLSAHNRRALETQIGVTNLVTPPEQLYAPAIASRIALESLFPPSLR
ncbi:MAG: hypothetical protein VB138_04885 [Burkholderia sp.]